MVAVVPASENLHVDTFDCSPELAYAQVLSEARSYLACCHGVSSFRNNPHSPTYRATTGQLTRSRSVNHLPAPRSACAPPLSSPAGRRQLQRSLEELKSSRSWKNALLFWRRFKKKQHHKNFVDDWRCDYTQGSRRMSQVNSRDYSGQISSMQRSERRPISGPVYISEFSSSQDRPMSRTSSGPLSAETMSPLGKYHFDIPYIHLRPQPQNHSPVNHQCKAPLYVVT